MIPSTMFFWPSVTVLQTLSHSLLYSQSWGEGRRCTGMSDQKWFHRTLSCFCSEKQNMPTIYLLGIRTERGNRRWAVQLFCVLESEIANILRREWDGNISSSSGDPWLEGNSNQIRIIQISNTELLSVEGFSVEFPLKWRQLWPIQYLHHLIFYIFEP